MGFPLPNCTSGSVVNPKNGGNDPMLNWADPAPAAFAAKRVKRRTTASAVAEAGVLPDFGVSTKEAFGLWDACQMHAKDTEGGTNNTKDTTETRNDLEPVVSAQYPEIALVVRALRKAGASHAAMTGSGSTVFGLFRSERAAARAARGVGTPAEKTLITTTIDRKRYGRASLPTSG